MNIGRIPPCPPTVRRLVHRVDVRSVLGLVGTLVVTASIACGAQVPAQSSASFSVAPVGANVPALEPSFTLQDVPAFVAAPPSAPRIASVGAPVESDSDHVARLMAGTLRCGEAYANDSGGRNAECVTVRR